MYTLNQRIVELRGKKTQQEFANELGISKSTLLHYEKGTRVPDARLLDRICYLCNCEPNWLLTGKTNKQEGIMDIPRYDMGASAGYGAYMDSQPAAEIVSLDRKWVKRELGVPTEGLFLVHVMGDSMQPTLKHQDLLLVSPEADKTILREGIFVIRYEGLLQVKRLQRQPGHKIRVASDNIAYEPFFIQLKSDHQIDFEILGRVVWFGRKLDF